MLRRSAFRRDLGFPMAAAEPVHAAAEGLVLGLVRLCRQLDHPVGEADLQAAGTPPEGGEAAWLDAFAARLGLALETKRMGRRSLAAATTPFLIAGPEEVWLARARAGDQYVLVEPRSGEVSVRTAAAARALGERIMRLQPAAAAKRSPAVLEPAAAPVAAARAVPAPPRRSIGRRATGRVPGLGWLPARVRGVLWQIALASVVINLLALATPLFMMTVYNKVINHAALHTLDVLAIGMVTLVGFELVLRALRGYVTAHTGARVEARSATTWCITCSTCPTPPSSRSRARRCSSACASSIPCASS